MAFVRQGGDEDHFSKLRVVGAQTVCGCAKLMADMANPSWDFFFFKVRTGDGHGQVVSPVRFDGIWNRMTRCRALVKNQQTEVVLTSHVTSDGGATET